jgi:hypothetical protein
VLLGSSMLLASTASAQAPGSGGTKEQLASAAFEAGAAALKAKDYEAAAAQFEAAYDLIPSGEALRGAIRARMRAGHKARAATLAAQGLRLFSDSDKLVKTANAALAELGPELHRLKVTCSKPCALAVGDQSMPGAPTKEADLYLEPGKRTVSASFADGTSSDEQVIVAKAGGANSIHFMPRPAAAAPSGTGSEPSAPEPTPSSSAKAGSPAAGGSTETGAEPEPGETLPPDDKTPESPDGWQGWSPAVFVVALGATAVLGGVTIWSGVDTLNNPGKDAVREQCQGLGTDCPAYQEGRSKQLRTNVLIGVTSGLGAVTAIVGLFLTDWQPDEVVDGQAPARRTVDGQAPARRSVNGQAPARRSVEPGVTLVPGRDGEIAVRATF